MILESLRMAATMPPASNADPLEKRSVALPPSLWKSCEDFAETDGEKLSEVYRRVMTLGISAEKARRTDDLSYENKQFVNERLRAKLSGAIEAVEKLEQLARLIEAIDVGGMDEVNPSEVWEIAAKFKTWLSE